LERFALKYLIITFILGTLTAVPVLFIGQWLGDYTQSSAYASSFYQKVSYAFLVVACTEEIMKYLVLRIYNYPHPEFDEPYDGIMYGVAGALGFAAVENVLYVLGASADNGFSIGMLRMFTAVPGHAMFGVMMGFFVGKAKFAPTMRQSVFYRMLGLVVAILLHGLYDFLLFLEDYRATIAAFSSLFIGIAVATYAIRIHAEQSPHRHTS
ncbi:MAG: PrsW family glutamic-type intramembrane protease, partial [Bacteroidota bacterium]